MLHYSKKCVFYERENAMWTNFFIKIQSVMISKNVVTVCYPTIRMCSENLTINSKVNTYT